MCGIAGFYYKNNDFNKKECINLMLNAISHRGPDERYTYFDEDKNAIFGINRLSIIDIKGGSQPFISNSMDIVVIYNGEIYNYKDLKNILIKKNYKFFTENDGEILANMYQEYGSEMFSMLDGAFAISIYVKSKNKIIISRDYNGEKPLYYFFKDNYFVFASEIKALLQFPKIEKSINYQAIYDMPSFLWVPEPDTIYKNIKALPKGSFLEFNLNKIDIYKYKNNNSLLKASGIKEIVINSIYSRLQSDAKVGAFLSGGIDSSIVTAVASRYIEKIDTFTIKLEDKKDVYGGNLDESIYAKKISKLFNTNHHEIYLNAKSVLDIFDKFIYAFDQPFAVSSAFGIYFISKLAKELGIKVLLSGDGADEMFGGYSWYPYIDKVSYEEGNSLDDDISFLNSKLLIDDKLNIMRKLKDYAKAKAWHYYASELDKESIFAKDFLFEQKNSLRFFKDYNKQKWKKIDYIKQDREFYLTNEMLQKVDRMCMINSVESRVPYISKDILELVKDMDYSELIRNGQTKILLKESFKDILPDDILYRKKHGFNIPVDSWLKNGWKDLVLKTFSQDSKLHKDGLIDKKAFNNVKKMLNSETKISGHIILSFIMINRWLEIK